MLFEDVKKILDVSREKDVDILVARDMIIAENNRDEETIKEMFSACNFIDAFYDFITSCRVNNEEEKIKIICELYEAGDIIKVRKYIKENSND